MCGRAICALDPENFLYLCDWNKNNNNGKILNFSKYKKSYNICPERYLPGIYKSQINKNFKEDKNNYNNIINNTEKSQNLKAEKLKFENEIEEKNGNLKEAPQVEISEISEIEKNLNFKNNFILDVMKWGTTNSKGFKVINARSETSDFFFKNLKKCVLIVQGFYEWKTIKSEYVPLSIPLSGSKSISTTVSELGNGNKNYKKNVKEIKKPYFFRNSNPQKDYLFIAGKYKDKYPINNDNDNENENDFKEFLILTQEASKKTSDIHHRMPIILNEESIK
jgi:putative SOS response-associated peptidase YedK